MISFDRYLRLNYSISKIADISLGILIVVLGYYATAITKKQRLHKLKTK